MDQATHEIVTFYQDRYEEATRLHRRPQSRLERIRTLELLRELLPAAPAKVLDVGGGPGAYARELLADGYRVRLVDLVPGHVAQARAGDPPVDAVVGDARELPEPDDSQDATLLLGPLYHLHEPADRVRALREAIRVTRPGGPILAAAISRFAGPIDMLATARFGDHVLRDAERLLTNGANDASIGFTHAYFHHVAELTAECHEAGLTDVVVHGVEGPGWSAAEAALPGPHAEATFEGALRLARLFSTEPELVPASAHLLVAATTPAR
ncbi:methyltransferase domain-containing protein [Actinoplanes oblitus]|uniref:Methyltransferase domain-containing protein n=1 Tax=Actinoplanes oblitus TaxID=3040509 RepID=A0ABY8W7A3_9ACTN|nr:class I SAM-dependent methyltransferase [Actinoplanes oblitus]WIM93711.1 methyltransferase domain-containing protein [Actinoplanes oblitus]